MTIPDGTEYTVQVIAWLAVWSAGGLVVRGWLAKHDQHERGRQ